MKQKDGNLGRTQANIALPKPGVFSIANQIRYGLLLLVILGLLITSGGLIYLSFRAQQQQLEIAQQERSRAAAGEINAYVDDLQRKLGFLARVRGLVDLPVENLQDFLEGLVRHNTAYEAVAIFNEQGQKVAEVSPFGYSMSDNVADSPAFLRAFKQKEDFVSLVEIDPTLGLPFVTLAVPIRDRQDEVAGALLARVNLEFLWFIVSQTKVGESGYAYVIDNRNYLIAEKGASAETFKLEDISDRPFIRDLTSGAVDTLTAYQGLKGEEVLGAIAPVQSVRWNVVTELPTAEAFAPIRNMLVVMGVAIGIATVFMAGVGIFLSRGIVSPLQQLTAAAAQIRAGHMGERVEVSSRNEMGILATTFNEMTTQLETLYTTLEQRVVDRTQRLEIIAVLSERLSGILNLEELLVEVVNQIKENFGYYHTHIYLLDDKQEELVVVAGTGVAGEEMKAKGHHIALNVPTSLVARAARAGEIISVDNVRETDGWLPNPLLPDTYSEMAVPIMLEGQVVGVLDVQEDKIAGLDEGDANLLRSLANQVAVAMRNARLFEEVETALAETRAAQERYVEQSWQRVKASKLGGQYHYTRPEASKLSEATIALARQQALAHNDLALVALEAKDSPTSVIVAPIKVSNKPIGALQLHPLHGDQNWSEDDLAVVEAVMDELAQTAENLRLFEETRERASFESLVGEITDKIRRAPTLDSLAKTAAEALGSALGVSHSLIKVGVSLTPENTGRNGDQG